MLLLAPHTSLAPRLLRLWDSLPTAGLDVRVREVRRGRWQHGSHTGFFGAQGIELLALADNRGGADAYLSVFVHEVGHVLWAGLEKAAQAEWRTFWRKHKAEMPSDYARTSAYEAWGDCFEWAFHRPQGAEALSLVVAAEVRRLLGG